MKDLVEAVRFHPKLLKSMFLLKTAFSSLAMDECVLRSN